MWENSMSFQMLLSVFLRSVGITMAAAFLFYRSVWGMLLYPLIFLLEYKRSKKRNIEKQKAELEEQIMHGMRVLNSALCAGLSMENAWREVEREIRILHGETALFYQELKDMNHSVSLNMPIEKLFLDFAYRSGLEDVISFAEVFDYGKRCGANWKHMIDAVVNRMGNKYDAKKEIEVIIAEKKLEQQIMNLMPLGMLLFLQISAWDYMSVLYHNWVGAFFMTVCLIGYLTALFLSEKILQIKV